ncbi:MAG: hypothetical protein A2798_00330 [Candidatus Levybacteria bacterium RIFCSPHIGHO2_01_FULL_37_17]|nr:MAG: hypothetical protein A2798_00330 [Candidatus Levybacteria bacterium RIFCSPHIGHO2_01_FULL_37_17]OGH36461.1 MAG: hypothetical protein A2959_03035 [Candidatus Levybacteria bacterium RIFCSPLOWO2_01_FULL_38_23]
MELFNFNYSNILLFSTKIVFIVLNLLFLAFLLVVYRQFNNMNTIVHDMQDTPILKSTIITILLIAISLLLTSLVIL